MMISAMSPSHERLAMLRSLAIRLVSPRFGAIAVQTLVATGDILPGTLLFIAADALIFSRRWRDVAGVAFTEATLANPWSIHRSPLLAARFFLLDVIPFFLLAVSPAPLAVAAAAAGLLVDRFSFYALAVQQTTEHEIADIEAKLASIDRPARG